MGDVVSCQCCEVVVHCAVFSYLQLLNVMPGRGCPSVLVCCGLITCSHFVQAEKVASGCFLFLFFILYEYKEPKMQRFTQQSGKCALEVNTTAFQI